MSLVQKIDISSSTIFRTILILLGFWFLFLVRDVVIILIAAIVIASAIEPVANKLQRFRVPRAVSVLLVYLVFLALIGLAVTLILPSLITQTTQLANSLPAMADRFTGWFSHLPFLSHDQSVAQLQGGLEKLATNLASLNGAVFQQTADFFSGVVSVLIVFVLALYLVVEENALSKAARFVVPGEHHRYLTHAIERMQVQVGRWVLGQLTLGLIVGVIVTVGLWILGVQTPLAFGLLSGIFEIIPVIGPVAAAIPGILVGFSQSLPLGLGLILFYVIVQQLENNVLVPNVMKKVTGLNPIIILLVVLLGARLFGLVGVMLAVPVTTMLGVFATDFFSGTSKR